LQRLERVYLLSLEERSGHAGQPRRNADVEADVYGFGWDLQLLIINMMAAWFLEEGDVEAKESWAVKEDSNSQTQDLVLTFGLQCLPGDHAS
jgi:hypothetical protein